MPKVEIVSSSVCCIVILVCVQQEEIPRNQRLCELYGIDLLDVCCQHQEILNM